MFFQSWSSQDDIGNSSFMIPEGVSLSSKMNSPLGGMAPPEPPVTHGPSACFSGCGLISSGQFAMSILGSSILVQDPASFVFDN